MSIFTNRMSAAAEEASEYVKAVVKRLGDREPLEVLASTESVVRAVLDGLDDRQVRRPEAPGKWSCLQVVRHLVDSEIVWAYRLRMVLGTQRPQLAGYDQDEWAETLRYADSDPAEALEEFGMFRLCNLRLIRSRRPEEMQRVSLHSERGEESVEHMVRLYAGHDLVHHDQLLRIGNGLKTS